MTWVTGNLELEHYNSAEIAKLVSSLKAKKRLNVTSIDVTGWKQQGNKLHLKWASPKVPPALFLCFTNAGFDVHASWFDPVEKTTAEYITKSNT